MRNYKEWFSANELTQYEGLPNSPQGVNKKARTNNWLKRDRDGVQGGAVEYHYSSLPIKVQEQLGFDITATAPIYHKATNSSLQNMAKGELLEQVPFYHTFASAGFGAVNSDVYLPDDYIGLSKQWLNLKGLHKTNLAFILADGDSMYPTIHSGDMLLIDRSRNMPKDGKIYVVRSGDQLWVKRVQGIIGGIRLISDNKDIYSAVDVFFDDGLDFEVIGQVVFVAHDLI